MVDYKDFSNMWKALKKSCNNVRWKTSVTMYEMNGLKNTSKLIQQLKNKTYKISEYQHFTILEPKRRDITATKIRDRQVQRALCTASLYNDLTKSFIYDNCACQINKGTSFAIHRLKRHLQKYQRKYGNQGYFLKCDIHHFFESLDHQILVDIIKKKVSNKEVQQMAIDVINSFEGNKGIGLGSQISQLLALSILDRLDHIIKEKLHIKYYIRYMDDFILIHYDKEYLKKCLQVIKDQLKSMKLELNQKTSLQPLCHGIIFLNWRYKLVDNKVLLLQTKKRNSRRKRRIRKMVALLGRAGYNEISQSMNGILAHLQNGNTYKIQKELIGIIKI